MRLNQIIDELDFEVFTPGANLDREVQSGYASDMLSDVMGHAPEHGIWVTVQVHMNIVAVASLRSLAAILFVVGRKPDSEVLKKAESEDVVLLGTKMSAFEAIGKLFELGVKGI